MNKPKKEKKFLERGVIDEAATLAYLHNELAAEEKQQYEKLLKDDPFAQEALEGLQAAQNKTIATETISSINRKVRERTGLEKKKVFQIHWTNYAWAAVLLGLLIGIGVVMITYIGKKDDNIAMNKDAASEPETNLFENKQELKSAEAPATVLGDTVQTVQIISPSGNARADETQAKDVTSQAAKNIEAKKDAATENATDKLKEKTNTIVTSPPTANGAVSTAATSGSYKSTPSVVSPAAPVAADERARNANTDTKTEAKKSATVTTTQKVIRGSIMEREEADKVTVITMDDAMKNFNNGSYKESSEQFDAILQQHPSNADALYFGGISDYINGNTRKSEKNFDKLLKEGTKFVDGSKWYKANILLQKDKREEAKKLLDELSQSNGSYKERAVKKKADAGL